MMAKTGETDLEACAREPIHVPGAIQPHGALLVLDSDRLEIRQVSCNASEFLGLEVRVDAPLPGDLDELGKQLREWLQTEGATFERGITLGGKALHAIAHRSADRVLLEFEAIPPGLDQSMDRLFPKLRGFAESVFSGGNTRELSRLATRFLREMTGFDRVLLYRFDPDWNGHVVGEDGNDKLPSYLDLRFPAGDIPAQARELYKLNRIRIIPDANYEPCPIEPANGRSGEPLDLSFAVLRSVSPVHVEYMQNMGTASSMSVSVVIDGELWGLVSCHSAEPHMVSLNVRNACDFAVQSLAAEIAARQRTDEASHRLALGDIRARLLAAMAASHNWRDGLSREEEDLLAQVEAKGAVIVDEDHMSFVGATPDETQVRQIVDWLERQPHNDVYHTDHLPLEMKDANGIADTASGLLAVRISELHPSWLIWFRPEVIRTVEWGGDPHKVVREAGRIHPRASFETWKEQVSGHSQPWLPEEISAAQELRASIVGIVLRRAEELAQLTEDLQRSNKELEAFSYSVSHDLRAPFRHIVGFTQLLRERESGLDQKSRHYLDSISESAVAAGRLVDDLLNFSQIGRARIARKKVDMNKIVGEVKRSLELSLGDRKVEWEIGDLPHGWGDATLLRQVWYNLIENAVKYTRPREIARIVVSGRGEGGNSIYRVEDNGVGFDMAYTEKLFGVFQRLQRAEDFEGTGIGLALTRRIVERHGGTIEAEGELDKGSRFTFRLPAGAEGEANV